MLILRPLYEAWLKRATERPLAPWQRSLLLRALERDTALRCFAMELAELEQPDALPANLKAPDLRTRLHQALQAETAPPRAAWQPAWAWASATVLLVAGAASLWWNNSAQAPVEVAAVQQTSEAAALRVPSPTVTPTLTASPSRTPSATPSPTPSATATPTP
jgi:hypothetical protein